MEIDIISISNSIDGLSYRFTKVWDNVGRPSSYFDYGDFGRVPNEYLKTNTTRKHFLGLLPKGDNRVSNQKYKEFPQLSKQLLANLFATIGVEYVPEILIDKLNTKKPFDVFEKFCFNFTLRPPKIDAYLVNRVILKLKEMDEHRAKYPINSQPVYQQLSLGNFDRADSLIGMIRDIVLFLDGLENSNSEIFEDAKEEFVKYWDAPNKLTMFKQKHGLD
jgi:hypothetical protein